MRWYALPLLTLAVGLALATGPSPAAGEPKSGTKPGEFLPGPFQPYNLNGEHKGKYHCLVCEFGLNPAALVFARDPGKSDQPLGKLIRKLDETIAQDQNKFLRAGVVFLATPKDESQRKTLEMNIDDLLKAVDDKNVIVGLFDAAGPPKYDLDRDAEVIVLLYTRLTVVKNYTFKRDMFADKDVDAIAAEFAKLSPKKR